MPPTSNPPVSNAADDAAVGDAEVVSWWGLVLEGYHATHRHVGVAVEHDVGLTQAPAEVLLRLVRTPGLRLPMSQVARECALTSGGFTKVADRLVGLALIRREPSDTDRRVVYAALTEAGTDVARRVERATAAVLREQLVAVLGADDARHLSDLMRRLRDHQRG